MNDEKGRVDPENVGEPCEDVEVNATCLMQLDGAERTGSYLRLPRQFGAGEAGDLSEFPYAQSDFGHGFKYKPQALAATSNLLSCDFSAHDSSLLGMKSWERFHTWIEQLDKTSTIGCWLWDKVDSHGYGYVCSPGTPERKSHCVSTHRLAYEMYVSSIPRRWEVHHFCETTNCCNPAHLIAVTRHVHARLSRTAAPTVNLWKEYCPGCGGEYVSQRNGTARTQRRCVGCFATQRRGARRVDYPTTLQKEAIRRATPAYQERDKAWRAANRSHLNAYMRSWRRRDQSRKEAAV